MVLKGLVTALGHTKKEKKDGTEYTHHLKVAQKGDFKLEVKSLGKEAIETIKKAGEFEICPNDVIVTIRVELAIKKEKFDKELENTIPGTGDPWYKLTKTIVHEGELKDTLNEVKHILEEDVTIEFV